MTATQQANVYLDGERKGMTPRSLKRRAAGFPHHPRDQARLRAAGTDRRPHRRGAGGQHGVHAAAGERGASAARAFGPGRQGSGRQVGADRVSSNSTPPGALIRIDGRDLGPTPLTVRQLRPGTHTLELRMPGYKPWSQRLTVAAGDSRRVTASLERDTTR